MITTSANYKTYFEEHNILGELEIVATLTVEDVSFKTESNMSVNGEMYYSNYEYLLQDQKESKNWATLEKNFWLLDDSIEMSTTNSSKMAWESDKISNAGGRFKADEIPCLSMVAQDLTHSYNSIGLSFEFDTANDNYPTEIQVETYYGDTLVNSYTIENTSGTTLMVEHNMNNYNKIFIYFTKTSSPYRRVRVQEIIWGVIKEYTGKQIMSVTGNDECDPLARELPTKAISLTIDNNDLEYNQDNPTGMSRFFQEKQELEVKFKDHMFDGTVETLDYGLYLLDGKPEVSGREATFNANGYLDYASENFYKYTYTNTPVSFKTLAETILADIGLPTDEQGQVRYYVDSTLANMYCSVPLPLESHKELLKLIAQACYCTLNETKAGYIRIEPLGSTVQDLYVDFHNQSEEPSIETSDLINQIDVKRYSATIADSSSTLYEGEHTINGTDVFVHIEYNSPAAEVSATVPDGVTINTTLSKYYTNACDLYLTTSGVVTGTITISGKEIKKSSTNVTSKTNSSNGSTGEIDNELISDETMAKTIADNWLAYAQYRNKYTLDLSNKYDLRLESLDMVKLQSQFTTTLKGRIDSLEWEYDGGISGTVGIKSFGTYTNTNTNSNS